MEQAEQPTGSASGSTSWENHEESPPQPFPQRIHDFTHNPHRGYPFEETNNARFFMNSEGSSVNREDAKSCFVVSTAFSFFASMCLAFGLYGSETLQLGPNTSLLIKPNHFFVDSLKVVELDAAKGSVLYGFYRTPPLDDKVSWSETHRITLPASTHKEWVYYLNKGSQISISYSLTSPSLYSLVLAIVEGYEGLGHWLEDPSNPKTATSWSIIYGSGSIRKDISKSSTYYIAVGSLNTEVVKVELNTSIKAFLYNTTEAYYNCIPAEGDCNFDLPFGEGSEAVLTSPGLAPGMSSGVWSLRLTYGPRWATYLIGMGGMICLLVLINYLMNHFQWTRQRRRDQFGEIGSEENPLLSQATENHSSRGSSFASGSDGEDALDGATNPEKSVRDDDDRRRLCAICFDAPKDCFFLPCGHCVSCLECATRIREASGACPICRGQIKKVRKIVTV